MTTHICKLKNFLIGLLVLVLCLAPVHSLAFSDTQYSTKRLECINIYSLGTSNGNSYLAAASCFGDLFNNSINTERNKSLNNKTVSLRDYNEFCKTKFNQRDFSGARDCFQAAVDLSCNRTPVIEEYCGKFRNNVTVSTGQISNNNNNLNLVNTRKAELNSCNEVYFRADYQGALNCYQSGINNTCNNFLNNTELDLVCSKHRNNFSVTQSTINNTNNFGGGFNTLSQRQNELNRCNEIYYANNYRQALDCYQTGINNTCSNSFDFSTLCDKNRNNYNYTSNILNSCYGGYNSYSSFSGYNTTNCRTTSNGTLEIIAGVATALVVACIFFCNNSTPSNSTAANSDYGNGQWAGSAGTGQWSGGSSGSSFGGQGPSGGGGSSF